jgi:multifunctional beta-oxidation protein
MDGVFSDKEDSQLVADAKTIVTDPECYDYTERDVILYNLGIGATEKELPWTFEGHEEFAALPTFGVVPQFNAGASMSLDWLPNFNPVIVT